MRYHWPHFDGARYYTKIVWRDTVAQVAPVLRWRELETITNAYRLMEVALQEIRRAGGGVEKNSPAERWSTFRSMLQQIEGHSLRIALQAFKEAVDLLSAKVLNKKRGEKLTPILR